MIAVMGPFLDDILGEFEVLRGEAYCRELATEWDNIVWSYGLKLSKPCFQLLNSASPLGLWDPEVRTLSLSRQAVERLSWDSVVGLLKHEMAHQLVDEVFGGHGDQAHGAVFQVACDRLGLLRPFRRAALSLDDLWEERCRSGGLPDRLRRRMERLEAMVERGQRHESGVAENLLAKLRQEFAEHLSEDARSGRFADFATQTVDFKKKRCARHHMAAAGLIARAYGVEVIFSSAFNVTLLERTRTLVILGRHDRVEMAVFTLHFVLAEAERAWNQARRDRGLDGRDGPSFKLGVVLGFDESLRHINASREPQEPPQKQGAVEVALQQTKAETKALRQFVSTQFPRLVSSSWSSSSGRSHAVHAGKEVGRSIPMPKPLERSSASSVKALGPAL
jgi:hypothetical protein